MPCPHTRVGRTPSPTSAFVGGALRRINQRKQTHMTTDPNTLRIRELNDTFRMTFQGGKVYITKGIATLPEDLRPKMLMAVRAPVHYWDIDSR